MNNDILEKALRIRRNNSQGNAEVSSRVQAAHDLLDSIKDQTVHNRNAHIAELIRKREQDASAARGQAMIDAQREREASAKHGGGGGSFTPPAPMSTPVDRAESRIAQIDTRDTGVQIGAIQNQLNALQAEQQERIRNNRIDRANVVSDNMYGGVNFSGTPARTSASGAEHSGGGGSFAAGVLQSRLNDIYASLQNNPNFQANSQYKGGVTGSNTARRVNQYVPQDYEEARQNLMLNPEMPTTLSDVLGKYDPFLTPTDADSHLDYATDEQKRIYNYLANTVGEKSAQEYLTSIRPQLEAQMTKNLTERTTEYAEKHPVLSSAESVLSNIGKAPAAVLNVANSLAGNEINPNAYYNKAVTLTDTTRSTVGQKFAEDTAKQFAKWGASEGTAQFAGNAVNFLYGTGMSMIDSMVNAAIGSYVTGASALNLAIDSPEKIKKIAEQAANFTRVLMALEATPSALMEAKERGLSDSQAMTIGLIAGAAEYVTEKLPLDKLFKGNWEKAPIRAWAEQAFSESLEEGGSNLINLFTDILVAGDKSDWQKSVNEYKEDGDTDKQAFWHTFRDKAIDLGVDMLGGWLSGGGMGVGRIVGGAVNNAQYKVHNDMRLEGERQGGVNYLDDMTRLAETAMNFDTNSAEQIEALQKFNDEMENFYPKDTTKRTIDFLKEGAKIATANGDSVTAQNYKLLEQTVRNNQQQFTDRTNQNKQARQIAQTETATTAQAQTENAQTAVEPPQTAQNVTNTVQTGENTVANNAPQNGSVDANDDGRTTLLRNLNVSEEATDEEIAKALMSRVDSGSLRTRIRGLKNSAAKIQSDALNAMRQSGQYTPEQIEQARQTAVAVDRQLGEMTSEIGVQKMVNAANAAFQKAGIKAKIVVDNVAARDYNGDTFIRGSYKDADGTIHISPYLDTEEAIYGVMAHEMFHKAADGSERTQLVNDILAARKAIFNASQSGRFGVSFGTRSVIGNNTIGDFVEAYSSSLMKDFGLTEEGRVALQNKLNSNPGIDTATALKELCDENEAAFWQMFKDNENLGSAQSYMNEEVAAHFFEELGSQHGEAIMRELMRDNRTLLERIIDAVRKALGRPDRDISNDESYNRLINAYERIAAEESGREARKLSGTANEKAESVIMTDENGNEIEQYSIDSFIEPLGLTFQKGENGVTQLLDSNGKEITNVTAQDIMDSDYGALIQNSVLDGVITKEQGKQQAQFLADTIQMMIDTQDIDLIWAVNSTIGFQPIESGVRGEETFDPRAGKFAAFTSNSDPQYGTTVDFTTICKKTQAVIDAMSEVMKREKHGLTQEEIVNIVYDEVAKSGEPVPCPVCYVFARWVGLGGLFDSMYKMQEQYPIGMDETKIRADIAELRKEIEKLSGSSFGKQKNEMYKNLVNEQKELDKKRTDAETRGTEPLTAEEQQRLDKINQQIQYIDQWTWLNDVRLQPDYAEKGYVDPDILFDINAGKQFAEKSPKAWAYRTSRGPAMGKAATPYAAEHLGQIITGLATPSTVSKHTLGNLANDKFLGTGGTLDKTASKKLTDARRNARRQNLLNGQRLQSTSDFRYEYALDYLMAMFELQSVGAKAQMYTKVPEMVSMAASCGVEVNLSLMPLGDGYGDVGYTILDKDGNPILDKDGKPMISYLTFSDVTGINSEDAFRYSSMYDNVQPIMVGINHTHIRMCMADPRITFIIPYHASGANETRYVAMMQSVGEAVKDRVDYSAYQTDSKNKNATDEQKAAYSARKKILTGKASTMTEAERTAVRNNEVLSQLHIRFYGHDLDGKEAKADPRYLNASDRESGRDSETYQTFLKPGQADIIMPHEFWDRNVTIDNAAENGRRFVEYCEALGLHPRFSGWNSDGNYNPDYDFTKEDGYWKTIPDRKMYNNDGTYHEQKPVNITGFQTDYLLETKADPNIVKRSASNNPAKTAEIADRSIERIREGRGETARYSIDPNWESAIDEWDNTGRNSETVFTVGRTSDALRSIGVNDKRITWTGKKIKKIFKKHPPMNIDVIKQVPNVIENPVLVLKSRTVPGRITAFGEVYDTKGYPVLAALDMQPESDGCEIEDIIPINSAYGKNKDPHGFIMNSDVLYVDPDTKRTDSWLKGLRLQLPPAPTNIGSIGSITYSDGNVNISGVNPENVFEEIGGENIETSEGEDRQSREVTPEEDAEYMAAVESGDTEKQQQMVDDAAERAFFNSKIRDEDGTLLPVYHGTEENFTVFDRSKGRANMDIQGSFFSPWELDAQGYGSNVKRYYLNITNPASESVGYRALNRFKGQNGAGIKARDYLESQGYDGVNNSDEEFIAFNSEQIKLADPVTYDDDGNVIPLSERFNSENDDIRYSREVGNIAELDDDYNAYNHTALLKEDTVDRYLKDYAEKSSPNYAQAYITRMSPKQFLALTSTESGEGVVRGQTEPMRGEELADAVRQQPIRIRIEDGEVVGHEGRHRMVAMERNGINSVPVLVFDSSNKNSKSDVPSMALMPQEFGDERRSGVQTLKNLIPLSYANRDRIVSEYGTQPTLERMQEKYNGKQTMRFSREVGGDLDAEIDSAQAITSAKTSIKQIPALFKNSNVKFGDTNVDIGGGRFDLATNYLREQGTENYIFDPFNRSDEENTRTLDLIRNGGADTATCANVLNVIAEPGARQNVILETAKSIKPDGTAYFMVYEGDGSGVGKETSSGWQNNRKTADYVDEISEYFDDVERKGKLIIAKDPKADLPKANWETSPGNSVRFSREMKDTDLDGAYRDALRDNDDETQRAVLDEMARRSRYKERLYHGTNHFGWTKADVSKSDDGISFFATNSPETAGTYTYNKNVRLLNSVDTTPKISGNFRYKDLRFDTREDLEAFKKKHPNYMTQSEIDQADSELDWNDWEAIDALDDARRDSEEARKEYIAYDRNLTRKTTFKELIEHPERYSHIDLERAVAANDSNMGLIDFDEDAYDKSVADLVDEFDEMLQLKAEESDGEYTYEDLLNRKFDARVPEGEAYEQQYEGIYDLYANTDNMLEIDGKGKRWSQIEYNGQRMTTRAIAKAVKDEGKYSGVIFRDIVDNGAQGSAGASDVYVFFTPESQVKSADLVTTDPDTGEVLMPSQRFDPDVNDLRWSRELKANDEYEQALAEEREKRDFLTKQFVGKNSFGYAKALDKAKHDAIVKRYTDLFNGDIPEEEINRTIREFERIMERPKRDANDTAENRMEEAWSYLEQQARGWVERTSYESVLKDTIGDEGTLEGLTALRTMLRDAYNSDDPGYYYIKPDMVAAAGSNDAFNETRRQLNGIRLKGFATQEEAEASGRKPVSELWGKLTTDGGAYNGLFTTDGKNSDYDVLSQIASMYSLSKETESPYERRALGEYDTTGEVNMLVNDIMYAWEEAAEITAIGKAQQQADQRVAAEQQRANERVENARASEKAKADERVANANKRTEDARKRGEKALQAAQHRTKEVKINADWRMAEMRQRFDKSYNTLKQTKARQLARASERYDKLQNRIAGKDIKRAQRMVLGKIAKDISTLDRLANHPSKDKNKYIPQRLLGTVAKVREAVQGFANRSGKTIDPARLAELQQAAMDETQNFMEGLEQGLKGVGSATDANARQDPNITDVFIKQADNLIQQLRDLRADIDENYPARPTVDENGKRITPTSEMIAQDNAREEAMYEYFNTVRQLLSLTLKAIRNEGKMILNGRTEDLRQVSQLLASDLKQHRQKDVSLKHRDLNTETGNWFQMGTFGLMSADAALQRLGGNWHSFIARSVREGQNRQMKHQSDFSDFMHKTIGDYDITKGGFYGDYVKLKGPDGKEFNVTRHELMSLYALWKRPAGRLHLENGGGTFINQNGQAFHDNNVVLTDELVKEYTDKLTAQEKEIVDKVVDYMSHEASKWGNDVSMYVYGYRLFNEDNYFPMEVADYANKRSFADPTMPGSGLNPGFTQALTRSKKPLAIRDFFDVVNDHIIGMANYNAYGAAAHDLDRILNSSLKDGGKETSMIELLQKTYGNSAVSYLKEFVQKLAGTKQQSPSWLNSMRTIGYLAGNLYKRQAVSWNLSTAAKQPLSIIRAANEIDPKYLIFRKPLSRAEYNAAKEKMESLSGIAKIKSLGFSDTGHAKTLQATYDDKYFSDSNFIRRGLGSNKVARGAFQFSDKFTDAGMWLAGKADEMTWVNIWDAVTREVRDKYPNMASDELDAKITERFNEVIGLTQVVDSILDSAPVLQEKVFSIAFPFMNEPVKSASNLILAASKLNQPGGKKKFAKAAGLQLLSAVLLEPLVTTLASMWRDEKDDLDNGFWDHFLEKMFGIKKDEDDDGKSDTNWESISTSNAFGGLWSMPFITQLYDVYSNAVQDYDNTSIDRAAVVDFIKAYKNLAKYGRADKEKSTKTQNRLWREFAESFASVLGVPAKTIRRQISGTARLIMNATDADELKWEYAKLSYNLENSNARSQKGFYDILSHAYATGNMETYEKFRKELNDIVTGTPTLVDPETILKNIEKRGGKVEVGDPLWNVEVQARFRLDTPVKGWKNENFLTGVYKQAESAGIKDSECEKVLYSLPSSYKFDDEDGNEVKMTPEQFDQFSSDCGDLAYKLVSQLSSAANSQAWSELNIDQRLYAIEKAYDYSKRKFRKDINPDLDINGMGKDLAAVYETSPMDTSKIASVVMEMAAKYDGKKDRKKK